MYAMHLQQGAAEGDCRSRTGTTSAAPPRTATAKPAGSARAGTAARSAGVPSAAKGGASAGASVPGGGAAAAAAVQQAAEDELAQEELVAISNAHKRFSFDRFDADPSEAQAGQGPGAAGGSSVPSLVDAEEFVLSRAGGFRLERASELCQVRQLLADDAAAARGTPLLLLAASGMGKSTLLAQMVQLTRQEGTYDVVHAVFVGSVERSTDALAVGRALCVSLSADLARLGGAAGGDEMVLCACLSVSVSPLQALVHRPARARVCVRASARMQARTTHAYTPTSTYIPRAKTYQLTSKGFARRLGMYVGVGCRV